MATLKVIKAMEATNQAITKVVIKDKTTSTRIVTMIKVHNIRNLHFWTLINLINEINIYLPL